MKGETSKAVIYCRVSTVDQVEQGTSLDTQRRECDNYAALHGFEVAEHFVEKGESAKTADRTELQRMIAYCSSRKNEMSAVIFYKIDRLSRNVHDYFQLGVVFKKCGATLHSVSENLTDTPEGQFSELIIAGAAQYDNEVRAKRSLDGMKAAAREGRYVWYAPIGYQNVRIGHRATIAQDPNSAPFIKEAYRLIASGSHSIEAARRSVTEQGLRSRSGKPIGPQYFHRMMKNPVYKGEIQKFGESHRGTFDPIVSEEIYYLAQDVMLARKRPNIDRNTDNPIFPLRRFVKHPEGVSLTGCMSRGRHGGRYPYYRYNGISGCNRKKKDLEKAFMQFMDGFAFQDDIARKLQDYMRKHLRREVVRDQRKKEKAKQRVKELDQHIALLIQKNGSGVIPDDILKRHLDIAQQDMMAAKRILAEVAPAQINVSRETSQFIFKFLTRPSSVWEKADFEVKKRLQGFVFPQGVEFDGKFYRTPKIVCVFNPKLQKEGALSSEVTLRCVKSNQFVEEYRDLEGLCPKK